MALDELPIASSAHLVLEAPAQNVERQPRRAGLHQLLARHQHLRPKKELASGQSEERCCGGA